MTSTSPPMGIKKIDAFPFSLSIARDGLRLRGYPHDPPFSDSVAGQTETFPLPFWAATLSA